MNQPSSNITTLPKVNEDTPASLTERGLTLEQWRILNEAIFPNAKTKEAIFMAVDYCTARGLDIFKRPVHIVSVWSSDKKRMVETVWPGISEIRTTAARTGEYAGKSEPEFGPDKTEQLGDADFTFPEWCKITVYRMIQGQRVPYTAVVYWKETYATKKRDTTEPNAMWRKRPRGQLAKCTEAEVLREAFPEEVGGDYSAEEMNGQTLFKDVSHEETVPTLPPQREDFQETVTVEPFVLTDEFGNEQGQFETPESFIDAAIDYLAKVSTANGALQTYYEHNEAELERLGSTRESELRQRFNMALNDRKAAVAKEHQESDAEGQSETVSDAIEGEG